MTSTHQSNHQRHMARVRAVHRRGDLVRVETAILGLLDMEQAGVPLTHSERGQLNYLRRQRTEIRNAMVAEGQRP